MGASHNRCAICRALLAVDADSADLPWLILGEEAHIVARKAGGPRGLDGDRSRIDEYENLILLCADDHKRIDVQPDVYSAADLRARKLAHERWAEERFAGEAEEPIRLVRAPNEDSIPMQPIVSGAAVWDLVAGAGLYLMRSIEDDSNPDASDAADEFLSNARDYGDISEDVVGRGFGAVREAQRTLQEMLTRLREHDLFVYGRRVTRTLTGGKGAPTPFSVTHLVVLASDEVRVHGGSAEDAQQRERRRLAERRKAAFATEPSGPNQVWQLDFSEYETTTGGTWRIASCRDYWAKYEFDAHVSPTANMHDAVTAVELALAEAERLLGHPLIDDCRRIPATLAS